MGIYIDIGKLAQKEPQKIREVPGWEVWQHKETGTPYFFYQNGKEWFDSDKVWSSPSGTFFLHTGMDRNGNEGIAITTRNEGLKIRKTEDFVETALITDEGVGYALTDEGALFVLTAEKASQKKLCEDYAPNAYILNSELCVVIYDADSDDDQEAAFLKVIDLKTLKSWKKKIKYNMPDTKKLTFNLGFSNNFITAIMPDQTVHKFASDGKLQK